MNYNQEFNSPIYPKMSDLGFFIGSKLANARAKKIYNILTEDFAGSMTSMKYRYWEANHLTDQV